jgi:hypothetical protein
VLLVKLSLIPAALSGFRTLIRHGHRHLSEIPQIGETPDDFEGAEDIFL